jgi:hypothetical protein
MTVIDRVGPLPPSRPGARAGTAVTTGFLPPEEPSSDAAPTAAPTGSAPVALDTLLALQQMDEQTVRDRAARRHGLALLAALGRLQRLLLEDGDQAAALTELRTLADATPAAADPDLSAALEMTVLRARIELARRT